ncbi:MAG: glycosyltransferase [Clostridia bacterium]|nr:glycosyltransferase [Clostridia bacterium]
MLNNKKILVIATTDNMIWQFLLPHIKHLQSRGNTVECVCAKTGFWFDDIKAQTGVNVFNIDFKRNPISLKNLKGYSQLKKLQKERQYDVVYCQQPVGAVMGRLIGKKFKIPVIYTAHGFHFFKGCPIVNKLVYKTVEKWLSKKYCSLVMIRKDAAVLYLKQKIKRWIKKG